MENLWAGLPLVEHDRATAVGLLGMGHAGPLGFRWLGEEAGEAPMGIGLVLVGASFLFTVWEYLVLTRRDVRGLLGVTFAPAQME